MKAAKIKCDLKSCFLCHHMVPEWGAAVDQHRQNLLFKKGEKVFSEGAPVKGIYFIYQGKVKIQKKWGGDKQIIVHFATKGDIVGYRGLGNDRVYPVSATALEELNVCFVNTAFFETSLQVNQKLTYELLQFYANELQIAERRMADLVQMDVKRRVADTLLMLKAKFGQGTGGFINASLTKQDLASYAGTTYETFSRMIAELAREKIVRLSGKQIGILNEGLLRKIRAQDS